MLRISFKRFEIIRIPLFTFKRKLRSKTISNKRWQRCLICSTLLVIFFIEKREKKNCVLMTKNRLRSFDLCPIRRLVWACFEIDHSTDIKLYRSMESASAHFGYTQINWKSVRIVCIESRAFHHPERETNRFIFWLREHVSHKSTWKCSSCKSFV